MKKLLLILLALSTVAFFAIAAGMKIISSDSIICFGTPNSTPVINLVSTNASGSNASTNTLQLVDTGSTIPNLMLGSDIGNIRLQVNDTNAHVGINVGGTLNSVFAVKRNNSGDSYWEIRGNLFQLGTNDTDYLRFTYNTGGDAVMSANVPLSLWPGGYAGSSLDLDTNGTLTVHGNITASSKTLSVGTATISGSASIGASGNFGWNGATYLFSPAAGDLDLRSYGADTAELWVQNFQHGAETTLTDYRKGIFGWKKNAGALTIGTASAGTGKTNTAEDVYLMASNTNLVQLYGDTGSVGIKTRIVFGGTQGTNQLYAVGNDLYWNGAKINP